MTALVGLFTVVPMAFVVINSFNVAGAGQPWTFGLSAWAEVLLGNAKTAAALLYSLILSVRAPLAVAVAFGISWLLIRVQVPGRRLIEGMLWLAFFLPALPITLGWMLLLDPRTGVANAVLRQLHLGPIDIYSVGGILWVQMSIATVPVMTMLLAPAFRMLDASAEEAAQTCGGTTLQTLRRITAPILAPAILTAVLAGLIRSLEAFEIEQLLGTPKGIYVYATRIYDLINFQPPQFPQAMALSSFVLAVLLVLGLVYQRGMAGRGAATVGVRGSTARPLLAGRWRYAASAALFAYIGVGIVLPLGLLVLGSFMRLFGFFAIAAPFTADHWQQVLSSAQFGSSLANSFILGLGASLIGVVVYSCLGYVLTKSRLGSRRTLGALVWLPWAIPGILLGVAILWLLLSVPGLGLLYGNMGALILVMLIKELPLGVSFSAVAFAQVSVEVEAAARMCGASWLTTYRRVMLPLIAPAVVSLIAITFIGAVRDISTTILLVTPANRSLSQLMYQFATAGQPENASALGLIIAAMALAVAVLVRRLGLSVSATPA
ncbi:MAG: iron ABC transporter permease [Chloroflexi bacterium]|nr:iron ABC transporter permease [Chloroflexota bacterium]